MTKAWLPLAILISLGLLWGGVTNVARYIGLSDTPPLGYAFWTVLIGALLLMAVNIFRRQRVPLSGRHMVRELSRRGIAVSSGSACSSGQSSDSPVLTAMGVDPSRRQSGLRLTLGGWIGDDHLALIQERFAEAMASVDSSA